MILQPISGLRMLIAELLSFVLGVCSLGVSMTLILPMSLGGCTPLGSRKVRFVWFHYTTSCAQILLLEDKWPSPFVWHLSKIGDIALATGSFILIVHLFWDDRLWRCSGRFPGIYKGL